mmetsp:Transcript_46899/g.47374  ORF Transcript_46899/g.47374 Transcript_46899/m.47374 type:complete len:83 (-) Transcript_46899:616-864(-)
MVLTDPFPQSRASGDGNKDDKLGTELKQFIAYAAAGNLGDADCSTQMLASYAAVEELDAGIGCDARIVFDGRTKRVKFYIGR